eukprot:Nitzschia sp. Nitz4//scaffold18_size181773//156698//157528//NITZ4_001939-RA/size181773-processed-gene-0.246-mRNA-1//-1//CDS//3329540083//3780//frame0
MSIQQQQQQQQQQHKRPDGRAKPTTIRPLSCEFSTLHQADGSASFQSGSTQVLAAVHGPLEAMYTSNAGTSSRHSVSVVISGPTNHYPVEEWSAQLQSILQSCMAADTPSGSRSVTQVVLQVIRSDGSLWAALLHAAVAALMDATIDLLYIPVATTCWIPISNDTVNNNNNNNNSSSSSTIYLDPCQKEEEEPGSCLFVGVTRSSDTTTGSHKEPRLVASHTVGTPGISMPQLTKCMELAHKATPAILTFWRLAMEQVEGKKHGTATTGTTTPMEQ